MAPCWQLIVYFCLASEDSDISLKRLVAGNLIIVMFCQMTYSMKLNYLWKWFLVGKNSSCHIIWDYLSVRQFTVVKDPVDYDITLMLKTNFWNQHFQKGLLQLHFKLWIAFRALLKKKYVCPSCSIRSLSLDVQYRLWLNSDLVKINLTESNYESDFHIFERLNNTACAEVYQRFIY